MILNSEQLKQAAHHAALMHDPYMTRKTKGSLQQVLYDMEQLRAAIVKLNENRLGCAQPAEEWLLDHAEFIEEQSLDVKNDLSKAAVRKLPYISKTNEPRVLSICKDYLHHTDANLKEALFISFIKSYQEAAVLTMAEVWAVPQMLRIALLQRLLELMNIVWERRKSCLLVERTLDKIKPADLSPETLKEALDEAGIEMPLSGTVIVHLVQYLRERTDDTTTTGEWLLCKLENGPESLEQILSFEYQLQSDFQVTTGNLIKSLRTLSRWDWQEAFEQISVVERIFLEEKTGDYRRLDFSSRDNLRQKTARLALCAQVPESLIASEAVKLANAAREKEGEQKNGELLRRQTFVAYYLLEADGLKLLQQALKMCGKPKSFPRTEGVRTASTYFSILTASFALLWLGVSLWLGWNASATGAGTVLLLLIAAIPALEWAVTAAHWQIERWSRPTPLLRYDFSKGVPEEAASIVVVPVIWSAPHETAQLADRLEQHYLANRDKHLEFALLSDFKDAKEESMPDDEPLIHEARKQIERLNRTYPDANFMLFQRKRQWNPSEKKWMGWERKRGKLAEFAELLKGSRDTSFTVIHGDTTGLHRIRYIITMDADTVLPLESARRMIGTMHLPYNRPRLNDKKTRVIEGYGVLQPRIGMTHEGASRSRLARLWAADPGVDPYAFAVSDPYQDGLGEGIFIGKGILDVDTFHEVLCERIPNNRVLSHDLLEGGFLRAGLLSDIELVDDQPAHYSAHQKRQHRWVRGDWQLLIWFLPKVRNRRGQLLPVDLSMLTRWQMLDNMRRSLLHPALFLILLMAAAEVLPGSPVRWMTLVLLTLFLPVIRQLVTAWSLLRDPRGAVITAAQSLVALITLPYQAVVMLDAVLRTIYRLLISKRQLLEWVPSAEVDRKSSKGGSPVLLGLTGGVILISLFAAGLVWGRNESLAAQVTGGCLIVLWAAAPLIIRWLDEPPQPYTVSFSAEEKVELQQLAKDIWAYYEDFVTAQDNWLPPDNVQLEPAKGAAHRTSPTNIGLYMTCALAARDFGFIDTPNLIQRLENTLDTLDRMETWQGHLYNWYDTETLNPLPPKYVSTVDSGNFVGCLLAVKEGLNEWLAADDPSLGKTDRSSMNRKDALHVAFAEELTTLAASQRGGGGSGSWRDRGHSVASRLENWAVGTDFRPLYDHKSKLFSLGYHADTGKRDEVLYDLMASEARQASFIAIALGQVSVSHWHALGRTMTRAAGKPVLLSWSGTMFEYLMPWLFMRTYDNTVWDSTYRGIVDRQIEYAAQREVPFGISESGYYAFDHQMNYQYKAFGVPGLGFKRGLDQDLVVSPYAAILAMPYAKEKSFRSLAQMQELGAKGKYGYYEAIDFTAERMPRQKKHVVIRSFMAHHQGMSMLTLANLLLPQTMVDRFHRNKQVRSAELLLQERLPKRPKLISHTELNRVHTPYRDADRGEQSLRTYSSPHTAVPEVCVLSNGKYTSVLTASGSGFHRYDGLAVTRWREDPVLDSWGSWIYIRDTGSDKLWSPSFQPCRTVPQEQRIEFSLDRAVYYRTDDGVQTKMEICVPPHLNAELRRISLHNLGSEAKVLEVTSYVELVLGHSQADEAHPAFSKLFIRTEYDEAAGCLIASRRKREEKDRPLWAAHALHVEGREDKHGAEFETNRAAFIGRGHRLSEPQAIRTRLRGTAGSSADPVFVMRRRIKLEPGETVRLLAITAAADEKLAAIDTAGQLNTEHAADRAFQLAWNRAQIELRSLNLTNSEAAQFQTFAGQVLYTPPLRKLREQSIAVNQLGQSGLWSFGISGERPIVLVRVNDRSQMTFIVKLLTGHEYLRRIGLLFDLVLLNENVGGYRQDLQEELQRAAEHGVDRFGHQMSGVYVLTHNQLSSEQLALLRSVARIVLRAGGPSLTAQLRLPRRRGQAAWPEMLVPSAEPAAAELSSMPPLKKLEPSELLFYNGWGGFSPNGKQYQLTIQGDKHLPAPWVNILANPSFGCMVSELGTGYTWWRNSRECKLTPWSNDPVLDPPAEICYLRDMDSGHVWPATPLSGSMEKPYHVTHAWGFSEFEHERYGIEHEFKVYVPLQDPVKVMQVKLRNRSAKRRALSLTYYAEWVLGVQRPAHVSYIVSEWDEEAKLLIARNSYQETFREATAFLGLYPQRSDSQTETMEAGDGLSWTANRNEFIGRNGSYEQPAALGRVRLSGQTGVQYDSCGAVQTELALAPGEEMTIYILLGCDASAELAANIARKYSQPAACEQALQEVIDYWEHILGQIQVSTPSQETDLMLNGWLLYQSYGCRVMARTAFYQAGGAFGYRDQLQDSLSLLHTMPERTRKQILLHAAHQYEEGDVQHWWHEETDRGIRTLFSDDLLWLPYVVSRYAEHTGDRTILDETAPYLYSEPLKAGEHERYEPTVLSSQTGTVYEHCVRAIDLALSRIGEHGLPLIGVGDWNDGMNLVGAEGRGESVWLGWFICDVLRRFNTICTDYGEPERAAAYQERRQKLAAALNEHAWDGQWFRRAFTDAGTWLGSVQSEECRIDAIAQSWSVISGAAPPDRAAQAMQSFERELVDQELAVIRLLTPPFDTTEPSPGYIQGYPPGIRENGAQYTHGVIWGITALCLLGKGDKAFELYRMINPITHTRTEREVRRYQGEPYVMAADVYTAVPNEGRAGWTWYTGAAGWMYQTGIESILGIRRQGDRLHLEPRIPSDWPGFKASYRYGATYWHIDVKAGSEAASLKIDGELQSLPEDVKDGVYIELKDDEKDHHVELTI